MTAGRGLGIGDLPGRHTTPQPRPDTTPTRRPP
nr:MAG TPA: hypothetical protein [Caudoviricetes sp.]